MDTREHELTRIRYPHMVREEIEIWKSYLRKFGERFERYEYDVHVGKGCGKIPGLGETYQRMATRLSQKRIDVVGYRGNKAYIIELKPIADMEAIGQLRGYKTLYEDKHGKGSIAGLLMATTKIDQDIRRAAQQHGIEISIV